MTTDIETKIETIKNWLGSGSINIFGLPYSGKDTHGAEVASMLEGPLIGGGDIIRSSQDENLKEHAAKGSLAPQDEYLAMILPYFSREEFSGRPLVLSSVGRWIGEEKSVMESAESSEHPVKAAIYLNIPSDTARQRWQNNNRARHDDQDAEVFEERISEFETKTLPVLEVYEGLGLLIEIDALPAIPVVTMKMIDELHARASNRQPN